MHPRLPEHVPETRGSTLPGSTYCMRCGLLLVADTHPDLDPDRRPCREVGLRPVEEILSGQ